jgi:hypothetical protein
MSDEPTISKVKTPAWYSYGAGITVTTELAQTQVTNYYDSISDYLHAQILQTAAENRAFLADQQNRAFLADQLFLPTITAVPPSRMDRLRAWLGYRVWKLAVWIDPDLMDY